MAQIHDIYQQSEERLIEEVRPKIMATGTSNVNMYQSVYEGESTDPNVGMTHYKGNDKKKHKSFPHTNVYLICTTFFCTFSRISRVCDRTR